MRPREAGPAAVLAGIVGLGIGGAIVYSGVRHPDVLTAVTHSAVGVVVAAFGVVTVFGGAVGFAAVMSAIAVTLTVAGFAVSGVPMLVMALAGLATGVAVLWTSYKQF